ncbi:rod shape-determining protein [Alicyclobacillus tolerans]|uniref:rod shape-determining protein n=1 Tax=Alicyclobacillus tolerans TaxID=90970 RepID=UPI001F415441|nr:rod shape-determining protein [Alicyclobacillus tolerans]MCF8564354.1 rod shape-determining protein [Alicyclobacillus tolerans]
MHIVADIGTSTMRVGVIGRKEYISEPNVVARMPSGEMVVGREAFDIIGRSPAGVDVFFPIEGGVIRNLDAAVASLQHSVAQFKQNRFGAKFELTIAAPSGLTGVEKRALEETGYLAGAKKVETFESVVAAAIGTGLPIGEPSGCLLVNLGAGVTEVAVLSMGGIVESRFLRSGGRSLDKNIVESVRKEYGFAIGMRSAEVLKQSCATEREQSEFEVRGRNLLSGLPGTLKVPRKLVDDILETYYQALIELIVHTIEQSPPELAGDIMDRGIVLAGGGAHEGSAVPALMAATAVPAFVADNPDTATIRGLLQYQDSVRGAGVGNRIGRFPSLGKVTDLPTKLKSVSNLFQSDRV